MDPYVMKVNWSPSSAQRAPVRVNPVLRHPRERVVSLDGEWRFRLDPDDEGGRSGWFNKPQLLRETIQVPGCWQGQGFGDEGPDEIWDFRIHTRVFRATYTGTGWYARSFRLPDEWAGCRIWLNFGGVHPSCEVWLNGQRVGGHSAPFVPFGFDVTDKLHTGKDSLLVVRVHEQNRWLGLAYNWAGNWSGLFRGVELSATGPCWLERFCVHPDVEGQRLSVRAMAGGVAREPMTLSLSAGPVDGAVAAGTTERVTAGQEHSFHLAVPSPRLWSPDEPGLYRVDAVLSQGHEVLDAISERVGFVQLSTKGKHFLINREPYYMRGSGDFVVNPETGSPDTCRERWRKKLSVLREYGYNYVRCQSYAPNPEYLDAADEVGLLVQSEMGMLGGWSGQTPWHTYAWPGPTPAFRGALRWQWNRTTMRDVNHPSANIYCMSNELRGSTLWPRAAKQCEQETKAIKPSAFVIWTDGGCNESLPGDFVNDDASIDDRTSLPVIQHEFRWWSTYPDVRIKKKYAGAVRPYAIEIAEQAARKYSMHRLLPQMAEASQRLQYVEARTKMENCRRDHPRLAGICHFNAMDIGLSPQGVVDEFYDKKRVDADTWRRTNGDTVVLIDRDFDDRVLVAGQALRCALWVSDFSHPPLERPVLEWKLTAGRKSLGAGRMTFRHRPFCTCPAGSIHLRLPSASRPVRLKLRATLREGKRTFANEWRVWLFPAESRLPNAVVMYGAARHTWLCTVRSLPRLAALPRSGPRARAVLSEVMDRALCGYMNAGGRVVLAASEGLVHPFLPKLGGGGYFFLPPANYPPYDDGHTGTIIARHPMLGSIPHEGFADLHFYRLIAQSPPVDLEPLGLSRCEPAMRALSTYYVCRPLAYLAEFAVGKGGLILTALDLDQKWPEARCLLAAMLRYAAGQRFKPEAALSKKGLCRIIEATC